MEPSVVGANPIPYKCSLTSIASALQLHEVSTKLPKGKNEPRKLWNRKIVENTNDQIPNEHPQFDPTKDLLYLVSTTHR